MNPIGKDSLGSLSQPVLPSDQEGDPQRRMQRVLNADMLRLEIYERVRVLQKEYLQVFNCQPSWVRISFDYVHAAGEPLFVAPCTVLGLMFILDLNTTQRIEVGSSVYHQT